MGRRTDIDWVVIELNYRLGMKSNRQLAAEHGIQASTIGRRAEKHSWLQDKAPEVRARSANMLLRAPAEGASGFATQQATRNATPTDADVEVAATVIMRVILGHRSTLRRISSIRDKILDELDAQTCQLGLLKQIVEAARDPNENGVDKRNDLLQRVIDLPSRVDSLKKVTELDEKVRRGEREAFNIEGMLNPEIDPLTALLDRIGRKGSAMPVVHDVSQETEDD
jgi:hypothetical protein